MTEVEARIFDLVKFSSGQKPIEFETTLKDVLQDRVAAAIENKKAEIAARMFSGAQEVESDDEDQFETSDVEDQEDGQDA